MSDLTYGEVRALISRLSGGENFIGIPRPLISLVGDHVAALVLNQALFYMKDADAEGWVNRSHEEWHADIYVSAYQLRRAFDALAPFGMETRLKKVGRGPTLHFRVDSEIFIKKLRAHFDNKETKQTSPIVKKLDNQETSQTISDAVNEETRLTRNLTLDSEETSETIDKDKSSEESLKTTKSHSRVGAASTPPLPPPKRVSTAEQVREIFDYWREVHEHPHAVLDDKRRRAIECRLKEGATVDFIKQAIRGIKRSKYHMGQNDRHKVYDAIGLICRDAEHLEGFAALDVVKIKQERTESPPPACRFCTNGMETAVDPKTQLDIQVPCSRCGGRKAVAR